MKNFKRIEAIISHPDESHIIHTWDDMGLHFT